MNARALRRVVIIGLVVCMAPSGSTLAGSMLARSTLAGSTLTGSTLAGPVLTEPPRACGAESRSPVAASVPRGDDRENVGGGSLRQGRWLGEDGAPLPFRDDDEIKGFLLTADVVAIEPIGIGVTNPERVTLEKEGVRAHAVFRSFERLYEKGRLRGKPVMNFRDSFHFETAAYELSRLLGMCNVPPTVTRRIGSRHGTLQAWVYSTLMEAERAQRRLTPPNALRWVRQVHLMILFDALIGNTDRNARNMLIDDDWKIWLVDHTRAFYDRARYESLDEVAYVDRTFWNRLRQLDRARLDAALGAHLSGHKIARLLDRRDHLVELIEALIAERGADLVLYDAGSGRTAGAG